MPEFKTALTPVWEIALALDVGKKRIGMPNQDAADLLAVSAGGMPLLALADGMGGHAGGELASHLVLTTVLQSCTAARNTTSPMRVLKKAILAAHTAVRTAAAHKPGLEEMGSTVVVALLAGAHVTIASVGDSRAYHIGKGGIRQLTRDQSVVAELVARHIITPEQALIHPMRNRLTMSVSAVRPVLEILTARTAVQPGDAILLCSDGLWGVVPEAEIASMISAQKPHKAVRQLVRRANALGGPDNISLIIAHRVPGSTQENP